MPKRKRIRSARRPTPEDLRALIGTWEQRDSGECWDQADSYRALGRRAIEFGHATLAYEIFRSGLLLFPKDRELAYLAALALAKTGSYADASAYIQALLPRLRKSDLLYSDVKSLQGRIAKDRWARVASSAERERLGLEAAAAYAAAYQVSGAFFPGINAATMNMLTGRPEKSRRLARTLLQACLRLHKRSKTTDRWLLATLGEACLLLGDNAEARKWYSRAAMAARTLPGDLASMRRQLVLLATALKLDPELSSILAMPQVVVFTGHMLDKPGRASPRFPEYLEDTVTLSVARYLEQADAGFGYCSAACGADIIFIEQMQKRGAEVHVILPFEREDFLSTSVSFAGKSWIRRFDQALRRATSVTRAVDERYLGDDTLFTYTAALTQGAALLRARQLETEAVLLSVIDETEVEVHGGTQTAQAAWEKLALPVHKVDLCALRANTPHPRKYIAPGSVTAPALQNQPARERREIKTMLFADMVGFSKLHEEDTPAFLVHFLGEIARVVAASPAAPAFVNTWGDGLFMVFDEAATAAEFALRLRDTVRDTDWRRLGLPESTSIRIGMHAGPVFPAVDPILRRRNYFGSHVNRAARIEPVTVPGAVYVSEQLAALLAVAGVTQFNCDFLGSMPLAKHFGEGVLYRLRRAHEAE